MGLAMRMWERESPQHSFAFIISFIELLHMILFEEKILLGEKKKEREKGREDGIQTRDLLYRFPAGGGIVSNSDKLVNLKN